MPRVSLRLNTCLFVVQYLMLIIKEGPMTLTGRISIFMVSEFSTTVQGISLLDREVF